MLGSSPSLAEDTVIQGNRIHDCGRLPRTNNNYGIYVSAARGTRIMDNWIYDNADLGIQLYPDAVNTLVANNVIDANGEGVIFSGSGNQVASDNEIKNNVIANSRVRWPVEESYT
jgi:parallel beta-helix repeat protein